MKIIEDFINKSPKNALAVCLGSGWSAILDKIPIHQEIPYSEIENFPDSKVPGHKSSLFLSTINDVPTLIFGGRFHCYEGYSAKEASAPIHLVNKLGIKKIVLTNAAGCLDKSWAAGDIMVLNDHLNLMGDNPLHGGPNFIDLTQVYDLQWRNEVLKSFSFLKTGVYAALKGPTYETPAEVRMLSVLGAHAVGMSTVPEAIQARFYGLKVLAFSGLSNMAAGISPDNLSHEEVKDTIEANKEKYVKVLTAAIEISKEH